MSILVRKDGDTWMEWHGDVQSSKMVATCTIVYADGRNVEQACDPYPVPVNLTGDHIRNFYDQGIWSLEEIEEVGGKIATPFEVPERKQIVGAPSYVEDGTGIHQTYEVEDIPAPPPPPTAEEKVNDMLTNYALTVAEFKTVLGLEI